MGSTPPLTITDQDPTMKVAIAQEFPETRHRYCMWHIMLKVTDKVSPELAKNEAFRRELNDVVWNDSLTTPKFEVAWKEIIEKFGLIENPWLNRMYDERASWIPACFEDVFMGGLLRTTSRSEAENRIFRSNTSKHICVSEFFNRIESSIRKQRLIQTELNDASLAQTPPYKTQLRIERAAASIYTLTVFYDVQKEICAGCFDCRVRGVTPGEAGNTYEVEDAHDVRYTVFVEHGTRTTTCECRMYIRIGLLCSHAFAVLIYDRNEDIPPQHITPRWTRTALTTSPITTCNDTLQRGTPRARGTKEESDVLNTVYRCIAMAQRDPTKLKQIRNALTEIETTWCNNGEDDVAVEKGKQSIKETFCGAPTPDTITVHPPAVSSTKGSGKRMRTAKEIAMKEQNKKKRTCKTCGLATGHNSRSCPQK
ncbi:PREDICTED: protein FAR-RED IMPAIRED RESPONSE 1-like [Ipomoea nil]|uniref:protein FAR-RED IMPAIRED RESPONSE 1-like n=1 Tax=Ipomoea nil TaxID=35883 RepID=UPI000900C7C9|nr:PREDICTED: protein FAR-RED IMPAIRED RESPONSE 1-like [Ipomoea nil]